MLLNLKEDKVISYFKWCDHPNLLVIDIVSKKISKVRTDDCEYITLKRMSDDFFISIEHFEGRKLIFSIRSYENPSNVLSTAIVASDNISFNGNVGLWSMAPRYYVERLKHPTKGDNYYLIDLQVESPRGGVISSLDWFDNSYDKGYQGILDVTTVPGTKWLLFSVQRSSELVLYDAEKKMLIKKIILAKRCGDPELLFRRDGTEFWSTDYDTLLKLKTSDFQILKSQNLQEASEEMVMQFVGGFSLTPDEKHCVVARPFNGDIVLLDSDSFEVIRVAKSKYQPLRVAVLSNLKFVCRDWKTGKVEFGQFLV